MVVDLVIVFVDEYTDCDKFWRCCPPFVWFFRISGFNCVSLTLDTIYPVTIPDSTVNGVPDELMQLS